MADFATAYLGDAQLASRQLGFPVSVILAQWENETSHGESTAFQQGNNFAGVSLNNQVLSYPDRSAGLSAYIQRWFDPVYNPTREAIAAEGGVAANPYEAAAAIEASPWAAGHYGGNGLRQLIRDENLSQYDAAGAVPAPDNLVSTTSASAIASGAIKEHCVLHAPGVKIPLVGWEVGGGCVLSSSQGRALLGAFCLVAGTSLLLIGLGFVAIGGRNPLAQVAPVLGSLA